MSSSRLLRLVAGVGGLAALLLGCTAHATPTYTRTNKLFNGTGVAGTSSTYHSYRIPSLVTGYNNTLFIFCEAHLNSASDWGTPIDLVYKRSTTAGASWEPTVVLAGANNSGVGDRGWTNPTAVYEPTWLNGPAMGRLHLFFNWHAEAETGLNSLVYGDVRIYYTYSDDNGDHWSQRAILTSTLNPTVANGGLELAYDNVGPGNGIRKTQTVAGQLVVPALSRNFYSTNHGATWSVQRAPLDPADPLNTNEGAVVECLGGELLRNDRPKGSVFGTPGVPNPNQRRWVSYGTIAGGFPAFAPQDNLPDTKCQGSILRYNFNSPDRILFLNSASQVNRCRMKVRISYDDGVTWPRERFLYSQTPPDNYPNVDAAMNDCKGGYSSMTKHNSVGVVAGVEISEATNLDDYNDVTKARSIDLHIFNIEWILNGQSETGF